MKIAIVGPNKPIGGISVHVDEISKRLRNCGNEVLVIPAREKDGFSSSLYYLSRLVDRFDIVHVQGLKDFQPLIGSLAAKTLRGSRAVATAHGFMPPRWFNDFTRRNLMKSVLREFDLIFSVSEYVQNRLAKFTGTDGPRLTTIYNGVDTNFFNPETDPSAFRKKFALPDQYVILYIGRLAQNKGTSDLIESITAIRKSIPDVKLVICGRGKLEAQLRSQVERCGVQKNVFFAGLVSKDDLPLYYASSDVVVVPSTYEPMGIVLLEAMSMRRPVVATRVGGIPEIVRNEDTGLLVAPRSPTSIANAVLRLYSDYSLGKRIAANGRRLVEREFTWERVAEATLEAYRSTVENQLSK